MISNPTEPNFVYTGDEAARLAGMSRKSFDRLLKAGRGPATHRLGTRLRVLRSALVAWCESRASIATVVSA